MILLELFWTFLLIGLFTFGGGYSMIALIQDEVVTQHGWLTAQEFSDMLAISQITPGPVGINTATYAGYSAVIAEGYPEWMAIAGAVIASLAVLILPLTLILIVGRWLLRHKDQAPFDVIFRALRLSVIGLIAAAAIALVPSSITDPWGLLIFAVVFALSVIPTKYFQLPTVNLNLLKSPIALILLAGVAGLLIYGL